MKQKMVKSNVNKSSFKEDMGELLTDNEVLKALTEVSRITFKDKFVYAVKHPVALFTGKFFMTIAIIVISCLVSIKIYTYQPKEITQPIKSEDFSDAEIFKKLQDSHKDYLNLSKKQRVITWIVKFSNVSYKLDGNPKYDQYDCVGAFAYYLWGFGSNVKHEPVNKVATRLNNLVTNGTCKQRKSYKEVDAGDIVVIQVQKNRPSHIGIVYGKMNNYLQIMDVSVKTMGMDIYDKPFNDEMIYGVFEMSFSFWIGDLLKEM